MGTILSSLRKLYKTLRILFDTFSQINGDFEPVLQRLQNNSGLPTQNPKTSYWLLDPPFPSLVNVQSPELPNKADVVIIGSGITGAAIARTILQEWERKGEVKELIVLEARELCSGATGRNGGHIKVAPYEAFNSLKGKYGAERAVDIVRFQLRHLDVLVDLCEKQRFDVAECRRVETVDVFLDADAFESKKKKVQELKEFMPDVEVQVWEKVVAREKFGLGSHVIGALSYEAGAIFPYRFVTSIFNSLLTKYSSGISIETNTPAQSIDAYGPANQPYQIYTPRGIIRTRHVIHATNAFASSLLPGMRGKMIGIRSHMSAQSPPQDFPLCDGKLSWSLVYGKADYDYMTQRLGKAGDLMLGGGFSCSIGKGLDQIAVYDDSITEPLTAAHLRGMIHTVFGENGKGVEVKNLWSGIICCTADSLPYVGKLDHTLSGRKVDVADGRSLGERGGEPAEWISAGYHGEGMVYAWLCGIAVARMVTDSQDADLEERPGMPRGKVAGWFPRELLVSCKRVHDGDILDIASER